MVEVKQVIVNTSELFESYRDAHRFYLKCQECENFGVKWGCPPLSDTTIKTIQSLKKAIIFGQRVTIKPKTPISDAKKILKDVIPSLHEALLHVERDLNGFACGFACSCYYCEGECARKNNQPCRHPTKTRPSLEACGFDLNKISDNLLKMSMVWGKDGFLPPYMVLISGVFYNP